MCTKYIPLISQKLLKKKVTENENIARNRNIDQRIYRSTKINKADLIASRACEERRLMLLLSTSDTLHNMSIKSCPRLRNLFTLRWRSIPYNTYLSTLVQVKFLGRMIILGKINLWLASA